MALSQPLYHHVGGVKQAVHHILQRDSSSYLCCGQDRAALLVCNGPDRQLTSFRLDWACDEGLQRTFILATAVAADVMAVGCMDGSLVVTMLGQNTCPEGTSLACRLMARASVVIPGITTAMALCLDPPPAGAPASGTWSRLLGLGGTMLGDLHCFSIRLPCPGPESPAQSQAVHVDTTAAPVHHKHVVTCAEDRAVVIWSVQSQSVDGSKEGEEALQPPILSALRRWMHSGGRVRCARPDIGLPCALVATEDNFVVAVPFSEQ
eukprot:gene4008-4360_t